MKTLMIIDTAHAGTWFSLTYLAAFLITAVLAIRFGTRNRYPFSSCLLMLASGVIFFIIGNKAFTWSPDSWSAVFSRLIVPDAGGKTILGGIIGLIAGVFLAKTFLKFTRPVLDAVAISLPLSMAVSRIGCLEAGCCYGTPTGLPWGIHYGPASQAWHAHLAEGLIHPGDAASLAVHPAQLYQVLGCLLIAFLVWKTWNYWKAGGSRFIFSVLCYLVLRFFVEFVRASESNGFAGGHFLGMKVIQWLVMAGLLAFTVILAIREATAKTRGLLSPVAASTRRQAFLAVLLASVAIGGRRWFDILELGTIWLFLLPLLGMLAVRIYREKTVAGFRWVIPAALICGFGFMAQQSTTQEGQVEKVTFTKVGLTGLVGSYYDELGQNSKTWIPPTECSGGYWQTTLNNLGYKSRTITQFGLDVSRNKWLGKYYRFSIGIRGFYGFQTSGTVTDYPSLTSYGASPYVNFDWRVVGFGGGLTVGQMSAPFGNDDIYSYNSGEIYSLHYRNFYALPSFHFRVGPSDILYAEFRGTPVFPSTLPYFPYSAGLGSGLGRTNGTMVGAGYCEGLYAMARYPVKDRLELEAFYGDNLQGGSQSKRVVTIGVHYRLGYKKTSVYSEKIHSDGRALPVYVQRSSPVKVADVDKNQYSTIVFGSQTWMTGDLKTRHYRDSSAVPGVTEKAREAGLLYPWEAVATGKLCPKGWHVPSSDEWTELIFLLNMQSDAAIALKKRLHVRGETAQWWSSTAQDTMEAGSLYLDMRQRVVIIKAEPKSKVLPVRCMKNL